MAAVRIRHGIPRVADLFCRLHHRWLLWLVGICCLLTGLSLAGCRRRPPLSAVDQLHLQIAQTLGVTPQFVNIVHLRRLRKAMQQHSHDIRGFLDTLHRQLGMVIPYQKHCPGHALWEKGQSLAVVGFAGMRILLVSLQGTFESVPYLACAAQAMKKFRYHQQDIYQGADTFWWAGPGSLVGIGMNPRPPLFSFHNKNAPTLLGPQGLLQTLLRSDRPLRRGDFVSPSMLVHFKHTSEFSLQGMEDMQLPQGISIRFHHMKGTLQVNKQLRADLSISMLREKHAMRLMGMVHLASALVPSAIRVLIKPLQAQRQGRQIRMTYQQPLPLFFKNSRSILPRWLIELPASKPSGTPSVLPNPPAERKP